MESKDNINSFLDGNEEEFDIRKVVSFVWRLRWWIVVCVVLSLGITFLYLKMQTPVYSSSVTAIFIDSKYGNNEATIVTEITGRIQSGGSISNEMIVLRSPSLMTRVVKTMGLNYRFYRYKVPVFNSMAVKYIPHLYRKLSKKEVEYYHDSPFSMDLLFDPYYSESMLPDNVLLDFEHISDDRYSLSRSSVGGEVREYESGSRVCRYGDTLTFNGVRAVIRLVPGETMDKGGIYRASYNSAESLGSSLCYHVGVVGGVSTGPSRDAITISYSDVNPRRAADILATLVDEYNADAREFKSKSIVNSIEFINERLREVAAELGSVESDYMNYQTAHDFIEGSSMTGADAGLEQQLVDLRLQKTFLDMVKEEVKSGNLYSIIPANVGNADAGLNQAIGEYNTLVTERERLLSNSSISNPSVQGFDSRLITARQSILAIITNLEKVYYVRERELTTAEQKARNLRYSIPGRQMDLANISRKQQIIEPLYLELNKKKEELQLSMFSIVDNVRTMEYPSCSYTPISPDTRKAYSIALVIALLLPVAIMLVRSLLRVKMENKSDIKSIVHRPVLATIPKSSRRGITSGNDSRDPDSESMRMLRSTLKYLPGNVIQVTSSVSGEGKSYVSSNLAVSLSHIKPRVALLGLDLRKPSLRKVFSDIEYPNDCSIVNYLIGGCDDISSIPVRYSTDTGNVDIFFSGPLPPNPTDLLSLDRMKTLMDYCRDNYDYVICDTPPFMMVADSAIINEYVDYTLYIVRSDYTELKMLRELNDHLSESHLKNVNFVLNSVDTSSPKYRYGYEYGYSYYGGSKYGYGNGYGYGYGYGNEKKKVKGLLSRLNRKTGASA